MAHPKMQLVPEKFIDFKLIKREDLNHNTRIFRFSLDNDGAVLGLPVGQHMRFKCHNGTEEVQKSYTPISSDDDVGYFDLLVKVYPDGKMTQFFEQMKIGDSLAAWGPRGKCQYTAPGTFHWAKAEDGQKTRKFTDVGMIAGGTGITPIYQVMRQIEKDSNDKTNCSLIFANISEEDIFLRSELEAVDKNNDNIDVHFTVDKGSENWTGDVGYVTPEMIAKYLPKPSDSTLICLCGPPPMKKFLKKNLAELGYAENNIQVF